MQRQRMLLYFSLVLIEALSLTTIWSTVPDLFITQLVFVLSGVILVYLLSKVDMQSLFSFGNLFYILSLIVLVLTLIIGRNVRGSIRWIDLGFFNLQTSEIVKPLLALFFANYLSSTPQLNWKRFFTFLGLSLIPAVLVAIQPDLGSALTLAFLPIALLAVSGHLKKVLILSMIALAVIVPLESRLLKPYQRDRLETFINPYTDPQGSGYNVIQATIAVGSGKLFGKGVRLGTQSHLNFLPERHTDFIFASFVEEFGLVGVLVLLTAYTVTFTTILRFVQKTRDKRQELLALSVFFLILFQFAVNIGMNLGIMPVTGITLPLFSYGGSSLLSFSILVGFACRQLDQVRSFEI